ncbi:MAG TPA: hypothetical protein VIW28_07185 [Gemmatimonadales bacterium]|jgi:hypothetical protein
MTHRCRDLLFAASLLPALLASAPAQTDQVPPAPELFGPDQALALTLTTNLKAVVKDRGSEKAYHAAALSYTGADGAPVSLDIRVKTRGLFRLKPTTCQFPPLMLHFAKKRAAHTLFAAQEKLKLVTHCQNRDDYDQYVVEEYLVYRVYNLLTERSLRVRLTRMTYVDSAGRDAPLTRYGFLLEDDRDLAARNQAVLVARKGMLQEDIDPETMGLVAVFQYMIGNTDWSVWGLHNIKLLEDSAGVVRAVPYDFDWSGVIAPPYAKPDARLPIQSVRQRLFRGSCRSPEEFAALFDKFQAKKDAIYALYRNEPALSPKRAEQSLRYYDDFYKTIGNPGAIKYEFLRACGNRS